MSRSIFHELQRLYSTTQTGTLKSIPRMPNISPSSRQPIMCRPEDAPISIARKHFIHSILIQFWKKCSDRISKFPSVSAVKNTRCLDMIILLVFVTL